MGLFSKPEVIIIKESSDAKLYLEKLERLLPKAHGELQKQVQKEISITKAGIFGEDNILFELKNSHMDMVVLHDIYIETKDGLGAQIDFVVVTSKITFIIECKNLIGNIEIDSKGNFIRTIEYSGKKYREGIYSPITQNERHMEVLKDCRAEGKNRLFGAAVRGIFHSFYKSVVVLANPKTIVNDRYAKKEIKDQVIRSDQLIKLIKRMNSESKELAYSKKEMLTIAERLLNRNIEERKDYYKKYQILMNQIESEPVVDASKNEVVKEHGAQENERILCPRCGAKLILRTAKKGANIGQQFYGCSNFPTCRYILNTSRKANDEYDL